MKFETHKPQLPGFQITPMLDVVFLLLCFFVASSVYSQWESSVDIHLPTADSSRVPDRLEGEIIVNVDAQGTIFVSQKAYTPDELTQLCRRVVAHFPGHPVVIRADKTTPWDAVMAAIDACTKADVANLRLGANNPKNMAPGALPEPPEALIHQ